MSFYPLCKENARSVVLLPSVRLQNPGLSDREAHVSAQHYTGCAGVAQKLLEPGEQYPGSGYSVDS